MEVMIGEEEARLEDLTNRSEDSVQQLADESRPQEWETAKYKRRRVRGNRPLAGRMQDDLPQTNRRVKRDSRVRGEAVALTLGPGVLFADAVQRMQSNAGDAPLRVKKIRRALNGDLLLEFDPAADASRIYNILKGNMGENIGTRRLQPKVDIEIRDIDPSAERDELVTALATQLGVESDELPVKKFRTPRYGMKLAKLDGSLPGCEFSRK